MIPFHAFIHTGCYQMSSPLQLNQTDLRLNSDYIFYYITIGQNVVTGFIPLFSLVVLNYLIYKHLAQRRKGISQLGNTYVLLGQFLVWVYTIISFALLKL